MKAFKSLTSVVARPRCIFRNRSTESVKHDIKSEKVKATTVDFAEVEHHSKMSNTWWDKNLALYALHAMNPLRVQFVRDGLANIGHSEQDPCTPLRGFKILDVGCGGGLLSEPLARIGAEVTGIDASSELISTAQQHARSDPNLPKTLTYQHTTVEKHSEENEEYYDAIVASEVLEHVNDKVLFLKSCTKALKPGGSFFITTINKTFPSWIGGIIAAEHILKIVPCGTHDWNKFISPNETQRLLETSCGCKTKLIHGMLYNPLKNEWFWTPSTAINYALHAVKRKE